ncbi:MAG TPA: hypothetical protein VGL29_13280 [Blastocatellia bacterium]
MAYLADDGYKWSDTAAMTFLMPGHTDPTRTWVSLVGAAMRLAIMILPAMLGRNTFRREQEVS